MHSKSKLESDLLECKIQSEKLASALELQNAEIQKRALDIEAYKEKQKKLESEIGAKYKIVNYVSKDSTCEQNLQNIRDVMKIYYKGGMQ